MIQANYTSHNESVVRVSLPEGERLGSMSGPAVFFVPADEGNREFSELLALTKTGQLSIGEAPTPPATIPDEVSDRQFFQELANRDLISKDEALAAVKTGEIPAPLAALLVQVPEEDRFASEMLISGATTFRRSHPLSETIRLALDWSPADLDDFWISASAL